MLNKPGQFGLFSIFFSLMVGWLSKIVKKIDANKFELDAAVL